MNRKSSCSSNQDRARGLLLTVAVPDGLGGKFFITRELEEGERVIESFIKEFSQHQEEWDALRTTALKIIKNGLSNLGIRARVTSRIKSVPSLRKKLRERNKRKGYVDMDSILGDQVDLVGIRISLFFPNQQPEVVQMLKNVFNYDSTRCFHRDWKPRKLQIYDKMNGEYGADHLWLRLNQDAQTPTELPRSGKHLDQRFEVQLRSLLMDVWSSMSHDLEYKSLTGTPSVAEYRLLDLLKGSVENVDIEIRQAHETQRRETEDKQLASSAELGEILSEYFRQDGSQEAPQDDIDLFITVLKGVAPTAPPQVGQGFVKCAGQLTALRDLHLKRLETDRKPLCLDGVNKLLADHTPQGLLMEVPMGDTELLFSMLKRMDANTPRELRRFMLNRDIRGRMHKDIKSWSCGVNILPPTISLYVTKRILVGMGRENLTPEAQRPLWYYTNNLISTAQKDWVDSTFFDPGDNFHSHSLSQALIWLYHVFDGSAETLRHALKPCQIERCTMIWIAFLWIRTYSPKRATPLPLCSPVYSLFPKCEQCGRRVSSIACLYSLHHIAELSFFHLLPNPLELVGKRTQSMRLNSETQSHDHILDEHNSPVVKSQNQCLFEFIRQLHFIDLESCNRGVEKFSSETRERILRYWGIEIHDGVLLKMRIATWLACIKEYDLLEEFIDRKCNLAGTSRGFEIMQKLSQLATKFNNEEVKIFTDSMRRESA
ncbi:uncharacterized protein TrAFT101_008055 [Trichoderma asperellum]|uniref:uncharacterized protein n=1 Tax=Trichoderma asperellum TaxID=101201 RepID=UPI003326CA58|nr:hypothetical protein TrAFT101_008055 [Trichoderma asperellum]